MGKGEYCSVPLLICYKIRPQLHKILERAISYLNVRAQAVLSAVEIDRETDFFLLGEIFFNFLSKVDSVGRL